MIVHKIPKAVAFIVVAVGLWVIACWSLGLDSLASIMPGWPAMKFISAICFVFSGIVLFSMEREVHGKDELSAYVASLSSLVVFLFMSIILASKFFDIPVGIEGLFIREKVGAAKSVVLGQTSLLSAMNFLLVAASGFILLTKPKSYSLIFTIIGGIISFTSLVALTGYVIDAPFMYSYIPGWSNGASFLSVTLFFLIGISIGLVGLKHNKSTKEE